MNERLPARAKCADDLTTEAADGARAEVEFNFCPDTAPAYLKRMCSPAVYLELALAVADRSPLTLNRIELGAPTWRVEERRVVAILHESSVVVKSSSSCPASHPRVEHLSCNLHWSLDTAYDASRVQDQRSSRWTHQPVQTPWWPTELGRLEATWSESSTGDSCFHLRLHSDCMMDAHLYHLHPLALELCWRLAAASASRVPGIGQDLAASIDQLDVFRTARPIAVVIARLAVERDEVRGDFDLFDDASRQVARLRGLCITRRKDDSPSLRDRVASIIREVVLVDVHEDSSSLLDVGATSLTIVRLANALSEELSVVLAPERILENPTFGSILHCCRLAASEPIRTERAAGRSAPSCTAREYAHPLSWNQEALWTLSQLVETGSAYNEACLVEFNGELHIDALRSALRALVERHESLRTVFVHGSRGPLQIVQPPMAPELSIYRVETSEVESLAEHVVSRAEAFASAPFALSTGPLLRAAAYRAGAQRAALVLVAHHLIVDEWSLTRVILPELNQLYRAACLGEEVSLEEPARQLAEYARAERRRGHQAFARTGAWWAARLGNARERIALPVDRPQSAIPSYAGGSVECSVPPEIAQRLRGLAREHRTTLFVTMLTSIQIVILRHSGQESFCIGIGTANRTSRTWEGVAGYLANLLPMPVAIRSDLPFATALARTRDELRAVMAHQDIPHPLIQRTTDGEHKYLDPMQVAFALHDPSGSGEGTVGMNNAYRRVFSGGSKFDLFFEFFDRGREGVVGRIEYRTAQFDRRTIEEVASRTNMLLRSVVADPSSAIGDLVLLDEGETHQLKVEWNNTAVARTWNGTVTELFEQAARRVPSAPAVWSRSTSLSYKALNMQANKLARYLRMSGVRRGMRVGVCLERSERLVVAMLGVLKIGAAYVPLDPTYPVRRLAVMAAEARLTVVLVELGTASSLRDELGNQICVDAAADDIEQQSGGDLKETVAAEDSAYVIFTSGSSGRPKGVSIPHRALVNLCLWHQREFQVVETSRGAQLASIGFDASCWELWPYLLAGASVTFVPREALTDLALLIDFLDQGKVTHSFMPTALAELLFAMEWPTSVRLRWLLVGGERLLRYPPEELPFAVVNNYGPTETTVVATSCRVEPRSEGGSPPPIGRPIDNTRIYLVDLRGNLVPRGVIGEIWIAGVGVGSYIDDGEGDRFGLDPFGPQGERVYKTGDLGRWNAAGFLEFVARRDRQVQLNGRRVELAEVEVALSEHPRVVQSVAELVSGESSRPLLVAWIVSREPKPSQAEIQEFLADLLPSFMIPTVVVDVDEMPLTANGKVERRALAEGYDARSVGAPGPTSQPQGPSEEVVAEVWKDVLGLSNVARFDDFFALGGDSVAWLQVLDRLSKRGLWLEPRVVYTQSQLWQIAQRLRRLESGSSPAGVQCSGLVPLSQAQEWFFEAFAGRDQAFCQALAVRVPPDAPVSEIEEAWNLVVARHAALQLRVGRTRGRPCMKKSRTAMRPVRLPVRRGSDGSEAEQRERWVELASSMARSLVPTSRRLWRAEYVRPRRGGTPILLLVIHHLVVDAVSWRILVDDLSAALDNREERSGALRHPSGQWDQWVAELKHAVEAGRLDDEIEYWEALLADFPAGAEFGKKPARPATYYARMDTGTVQGSLKRVEDSALLQDLLLAALGLAWRDCLDSDAVGVMVEGHGRWSPDSISSATTVGWFTCLYPLRIEAPYDEPDERILDRVRATTSSVPNGGVGFGALMAFGGLAVRERFEMSSSPQVLFNYLGRMAAESDQASIRAIPLYEVAGRGRGLPNGYRFGLDAWLSGSTLHLAIAHDRSRDSEAYVSRFASAVLNRLNSLMAVAVAEPRPVIQQRSGLGAEVRLRPDIVPAAVVSKIEPPAILLTGATGFLGRALVCRLLAQTSARIYCLVRARSESEAADRLEDALGSEAFDQGPSGRVIPLSGDLAAPALGLNARVYGELSRSISAVYHNGASVNLLAPYEALRRTNVDGTSEALRFACEGSRKEFHYISTISMVTAGSSGCSDVTESSRLPQWERLRGGYLQSKWVAEGLVRLASERGLRTAVYRVGTLYSNEHDRQQNDLFAALVRGLAEMGCAFRLPEALRFLSQVDATAQALVALAVSPTSGFRETYHLVNPSPIDLGWIIEAIRMCGHSISLLQYDEWQKRLRQNPRKHLSPLVDLFPVEGIDLSVYATARSDMTQARLSALGFEWEVHTATSIDASVRRVLLAPPSASPFRASL